MVQGTHGGSRMEEKVIRVEESMERQGSIFGWVVHGAGEVTLQSVCVCMCVCVRHECPASPGSQSSLGALSTTHEAQSTLILPS